MIGTITYETIGFNPTGLLVTIGVVLLVSGILALLHYTVGDNYDLYGLFGLLVLIFGGLLGPLVALLVEASLVDEVNHSNFKAAAYQSFDELGYTELTLDGTNWPASLDGKFTKGALIPTDEGTYEIYWNNQ